MLDAVDVSTNSRRQVDASSNRHVVVFLSGSVLLVVLLLLLLVVVVLWWWYSKVSLLLSSFHRLPVDGVMVNIGMSVTGSMGIPVICCNRRIPRDGFGINPSVP